MGTSYCLPGSSEGDGNLVEMREGRRPSSNARHPSSSGGPESLLGALHRQPQHFGKIEPAVAHTESSTAVTRTSELAVLQGVIPSLPS
jgi:hypothetical protein